MQIICTQSYEISDECLVDSLVGEQFYFLMNQMNATILVSSPPSKVQSSANSESENEPPAKQTHQYSKGLSTLQLSALQQRQVSSYLWRIQQWLQAKYNVNFLDSTTQIPADEVKMILVQALVHPQQPYLGIVTRYSQWKSSKRDLQQMQVLKYKAEEMSRSIAKKRMYIELAVLFLNINMIWAGTYVYFSWDIIEPIAYFTSSAASIYLLNQFRKTLKMYTPATYQQFLAERYYPLCCKKVGLDMQELAIKEKITSLQEKLWKTQLASYL